MRYAKVETDSQDRHQRGDQRTAAAMGGELRSALVLSMPSPQAPQPIVVSEVTRSHDRIEVTQTKPGVPQTLPGRRRVSGPAQAASSGSHY